MKKKISIFLTMVLLVSMAIFPTYAESMNVNQTETVCTKYGNFEVETTLIVYDSVFRSTKTVERTQTVKDSGVVIANITLTTTFGYDGKTAWVVSASGSHTTSNGWNYKNESISKSGATAKLTANLSKLLYPTFDVNISISCSPTGQIS